MRHLSEEDQKKKKKRSKSRSFKTTTITNELIEHSKNMRKVTVNTVMDTMMKMVPRALQVKEQILEDPLSSDNMKNIIASDILDRTIPKPSQNVNIRGAMVTAQMTERELREMVIAKVQGDM